MSKQILRNGRDSLLRFVKNISAEVHIVTFTYSVCVCGWISTSTSSYLSLRENSHHLFYCVALQAILIFYSTHEVIVGKLQV